MDIILRLILFVLLFQGVALAQADLQQAEKMMATGDLKAARSLILDALKQNPAQPTALRLMGELYAKERNFQLAELYLQLALEKSTKPGEKLLFDLALALQNNHKFEEALQIVNQAKEDPKLKKRFELIERQCTIGKALMQTPGDFKIVNAGSALNTSLDEAGPQVLRSSFELLINRRNEKKWTIYKQSAKLEKIRPELFLLPGVGSEWQLAGSDPDGKVLFLRSPEHGGDLYMVEFEKGQFSKPERLPHQTPFDEHSATLSADGKSLFFSSNRKGNYNIYLCSRVGKKWGKPILLGPNINTANDEISPYIQPDGRYLYFSSNGVQSMGGFDVLRSDLFSKGKPENLGFPINSAADEIDYKVFPEENVVFYASNRNGGEGGFDVYEIFLAGARSAPLALLKGTVSDPTGMALEAQVSIHEAESGKLFSKLKTNPATGTFFTTLPKTGKYSVLVEKEGYLFYSEKVDFTESQDPELDKKIILQKLIVGVVLPLNNVFFDFGKSSLKKESSPELQRVLLLLRQNPGLKVEILNFSADFDVEELNLKLAENRAQAIVDYLVATGIKATRLLAKGQAATSSAHGADKNMSRRSEFKILEFN